MTIFKMSKNKVATLLVVLVLVVSVLSLGLVIYPKYLDESSATVHPASISKTLPSTNLNLPPKPIPTPTPYPTSSPINESSPVSSTAQDLQQNEVGEGTQIIQNEANADGELVSTLTYLPVTSTQIATFTKGVSIVQTNITYNNTPIITDNGYSIQLNAMGENDTWWQGVLAIEPSNDTAYWVVNTWQLSTTIFTMNLPWLQGANITANNWVALPQNVADLLINGCNETVSLEMSNKAISINILSNDSVVYSNTYPINAVSFFEIQPVIVGDAGGQTATFTQANFTVSTAFPESTQQSFSMQTSLTLEKSNIIETQISGSTFKYGIST